MAQFAVDILLQTKADLTGLNQINSALNKMASTASLPAKAMEQISATSSVVAQNMAKVSKSNQEATASTIPLSEAYLKITSLVKQIFQAQNLGVQTTRAMSTEAQIATSTMQKLLGVSQQLPPAARLFSREIMEAIPAMAQLKAQGIDLTKTFRETQVATKRFKAELLSLLFFGMALQRTFGNFLRGAIEGFRKVDSQGVTPLSKKFTELEAAVTFFNFTLTQALAPLIMGLLDVVIQFVDLWADLPRPVQQFVGLLGAAGFIFGSLLLGIGIIGLGLQGIASLATTLGLAEVFTAAGIAIEGIGLGGLLVGLAVLAAAVLLLEGVWRNNFGKIQDITTNTFEVISKSAEDLFTKDLPQFIGGFGKVIDGLTSNDFPKITQGITDIGAGAIGVFVDIIVALSNLIIQAGVLLASFTAQAIVLFIKVLKTVQLEAAKATQALAEGLNAQLGFDFFDSSGATQSITALEGDISDLDKRFIAAGKNASNFSDSINRSSEQVRSDLREFFELSQGFEEVTTETKKTSENIDSIATNTQSASEALKQMKEDVTGLSTDSGSFSFNVSNFVAEAKKGAKDFNTSFSESIFEDAKSTGLQFQNQFAQGLDNNFPIVDEQTLANNEKLMELYPLDGDAQRGPLSNVTASGQSMVTQFATGVLEAGPVLDEAVSEVFTTSMTSALDIVTDFVGQIIAEVNRAIEAIRRLQAARAAAAISAARINVNQTTNINGTRANNVSSVSAAVERNNLNILRAVSKGV